MNATRHIFRMATAMFMLLSGLLTQAQDRLFTYTYQSTVLNKGQKELEIWNTFRTGRDDYYFRLDSRAEFEIGLGSNLQIAFYTNLTTKTQAVGPDSARVLKTDYKLGFSNEWKYKLLDPVADPLGLALYAEIGIGSNEFELEGKLIVDKVINRVTLAANGVYELELKPTVSGGSTAFDNEQKADLYMAFAWSVNQRFHLTLESGWKNMFEQGTWAHSAIYAGPGISWVNDSFWVNLTVLPQVASVKGETNGSLNLNEYERIQCRLLFSYVF